MPEQDDLLMLSTVRCMRITDVPIPDEVDGIPLEFRASNHMREFLQLIDDGASSARYCQMYFSEDPFPYSPWESQHIKDYWGVNVSEWEPM